MSTSKFVFAKKDSTTVKYHDYLIGIDASKFVAKAIAKNRTEIEFQFDKRYRKNIYLVSELGFGNSTTANDFINYKSNNVFVRLGLDQTFFNEEFKGDLDNAFIGLRYGLGYINRQTGNYTIYDPVYGSINGTIADDKILLHWLELTGGFRMEVYKNILLGWNIRFKTIVNYNRISELPPAYIAGYGVGDKSAVFGYNFYVLYHFGKR